MVKTKFFNFYAILLFVYNNKIIIEKYNFTKLYRQFIKIKEHNNMAYPTFYNILLKLQGLDFIQTEKMGRNRRILKINEEKIKLFLDVNEEIYLFIC